MKREVCWTLVIAVLAMILTACVQMAAPTSPEPTAPLALAGQPTPTPCVVSVHAEPPGWPVSFEEAVSHAELVALADVLSVSEGPDIASDPTYPDYRMPTHLTTIQVVRAYKGAVTSGQNLIVYQFGIGIVTDLSSPLWSDDYRQCNQMLIFSDDEPVYQPGERYVLALTPVVFSEVDKGSQPEPLPEGMVRTLWRGRLLINQDGTLTSVTTDAAGCAIPGDIVGVALEEIEARIASVLVGEYATPTPVPTPAPSHPVPTPVSFPGDFQVTLTATPQEGMAPLTVQWMATLSGGPDNSYELNCSILLWQTGDGIEIPTEMTCATWSPEISIGRQYTMGHTYTEAGTYQAQVRMGQGEHSLVSNVVTIEVR